MKIDEYVERYGKIIKETDASFHLYKSIKLNAGSEFDKVNRYDHMFSVILIGLQYEYILNLCKLLSQKNNEKKNLFKFIESCKCNKSKSNDKLFLEKVLREFETKLQDEEKTINKIISLRDNYFSHYDPTYFLTPSDAFTQSGLLNDDVERLIALLVTYIENICFCFGVTYNKDYKTVMDVEWNAIIKKLDSY